jgi:hypothetical protein
MNFMTKNGFELLYLNRVFEQRRKIFMGKSRGQITYGDALFGRREDQIKGYSKAKLMKYILLLVNYGHIDFAYHIAQLHPGVNDFFPISKLKYFNPSYGTKIRRFLSSQIDKCVLLWLQLRKYNHMNIDYDRGWPYR